MKTINLFFGEIGDNIGLNVMPWESENALNTIRKIRKKGGKKKVKAFADFSNIKNIKTKNGLKNN